MAQFPTKYTTQVIPSESSIRSQVPTLFNKMMDNIRVALKDQFLWVAIDETTDQNNKGGGGKRPGNKTEVVNM